MAGTLTASDVRRRLVAGGEIAFLDVREEGPYSLAQPLFAVNLPLSRMEDRVAALVPRRAVPVALFDDGEGLAGRAAARLAEFGYSDVSVVTGGLAGWRAAGGELFRDVNVPSKAFGEWVEAHRHTPMIDAADLARLIASGADVRIFDARPFHEYQAMTIPGSIDCPGAELLRRVPEQVPSPETLVVVHCAGRTRSIIGAQSLINAGLPNPVRALRNGTIGWTLAGLELDVGAARRAPAPRDTGWARTAARSVAARAGVRFLDRQGLTALEADAGRTLYRFDVRPPEDYLRGHAAAFTPVPGGQLVQATDEVVGVRGARLVLACGDGVAAAMTASWLRQMGWEEVYVLDEPMSGLVDTYGPRAIPEASPPPVGVEVTPGDLAVLLAGGGADLIDLTLSPLYRFSHIPGARFAIRSRFAADLPRLPGDGPLVLTSSDGRLARWAAAEAAAVTGREVRVLAGGTAAWSEDGRSLTDGGAEFLSAPDDVYRRPYEGTGNSEAAMRGYIDWELELVDQIRRDGTAAFRPL